MIVLIIEDFCHGRKLQAIHKKAVFISSLDIGCQELNSNKPYRWAVDNQCHSIQLIPDASCKDPLRPFLCPAAQESQKPECKKSYSDCTTVVHSCHHGNKPYSCSNGQCTSTTTECHSILKAQKFSQLCSDRR